MRRERGFTLIELLVVIIILGILLAVAIPRYFEGIQQAKIKAHCSTIANLRMALEVYRTTNGPSYTYPASTASVEALFDDPKYFVNHPKDPWNALPYTIISGSNPGNYNEIGYQVSDDHQSYTLTFVIPTADGGTTTATTCP